MLLVYYCSAKSRCKTNLENTSKYDFSPDLGGKNGGVPSMRMQVILDSSSRPPGLSPYMRREGRRVQGLDYYVEGIPPLLQQPPRMNCLKPSSRYQRFKDLKLGLKKAENTKVRDHSKQHFSKDQRQKNVNYNAEIPFTGNSSAESIHL